MRAVRQLALATIALALAGTLTTALAAPAYAIECEGIALPEGCLFTITGGDTPYPDDGFAVTNADGVPMWDFVREQDLQAIGYPISQRWTDGPFTLQAFQKVILQWDPGKQRVNWYNTLDALANKYPDVELPNVPSHQLLEADQGVTNFGVIIRNHLALLDANPKIKSVFLAEPNWLNLYGLPIRYEEREVNGNPQGLHVLRAQRTVFAIWNVPAPGTSLGTVLLQNIPDKIKKLSNIIIPDTAKQPIAIRAIDRYFEPLLHHMSRADQHKYAYLTTRPWFIDGLDYAEKARVVASQAYRHEDQVSYERFLDSPFIQSRTIQLPLTGPVHIWLFQSHEFNPADNLMPNMERVVRTLEDFLGVPFPTTDIILVVVDNQHSTPHGGYHAGTHIVVKRWDPNDTITNDAIYHEIAHYYFRGWFDHTWLIEGGANFIAAYIKHQTGEVSFREWEYDTNDYLELNCIEILGTTTIHALEQLIADLPGSYLRCNYNFGAFFLFKLHALLGDDVLGGALGQAYRLAQTDRPAFSDEELYEIILKTTPPHLKADLQSLYKRFHGGPFTSETRASDVTVLQPDVVPSSITAVIPWAQHPPDDNHIEALAAIAAIWGAIRPKSRPSPSSIRLDHRWNHHQRVGRTHRRVKSCKRGFGIGPNCGGLFVDNRRHQILGAEGPPGSLDHC